jgi:hypothetical protein
MSIRDSPFGRMNNQAERKLPFREIALFQRGLPKAAKPILIQIGRELIP